jgi:Uma2 family endonuclease
MTTFRNPPVQYPSLNGQALSAEAFEAMLPTLDPNIRYELHKGSIIDVGTSSRLHTLIGLWIGALLMTHVRNSGMGGEVTGADGTYILSPQDTAVPDCAYVSAEKTKLLSFKTVFYPFAPDLAVEIRSPSQSKREMQALAQLYLGAGAKLVWIVHPLEQVVEVYWVDGTHCRLTVPAQLEGESVLPEFKITLTELFSVLPKDDTA